MMKIITDFRLWLADELIHLPLTPEGKAYVVSVLAKAEDLSQRILSIEFLEAKLHRNVTRLISVGDWGVYRGTLDPASLHTDGDFLLSVSQMAYREVVEMSMGQLVVFKEIAEKMDEVVKCTHEVVSRRGLVLPPKVNSRPMRGVQ
jgi:hypothetical protein